MVKHRFHCTRSATVASSRGCGLRAWMRENMRRWHGLRLAQQRKRPRQRLERQKAEFGDEREQLHRRIGEMEEQVGKLHEEAKKRDKQFLKVG